MGRFFLSLGGFDGGSAFGGMGASREALVSSLAEAPFLLSFVAVAILASHADIAGMVAWTLQQNVFNISAVHILAFTSLAMVVIAETGRMPVDNPTTHLELTMIHEGMVLEYSGPSLALIEWASAIKLHAMLALLIALFGPWGMASSVSVGAISLALLLYCAKVALLIGAIGSDREWSGQTADVSRAGFSGSCFRSERSGGDLYDVGEEVTKWAWWKLQPGKILSSFSVFLFLTILLMAVARRISTSVLLFSVQSAIIAAEVFATAFQEKLVEAYVVGALVVVIKVVAIPRAFFGLARPSENIA